MCIMRGQAAQDALSHDRVFNHVAGLQHSRTPIDRLSNTSLYCFDLVLTLEAASSMKRGSPLYLRNLQPRASQASERRRRAYTMIPYTHRRNAPLDCQVRTWC